MGRLIDADELIKFFQEMEDKYHEASEQAVSEYGIMTLIRVAKVYENAIAMVNALAEEHNNGWIPCSERLPKETNDYLVTQYNKNAIDEYCDGYKVETLFFDENGWWDDTDYYCGWEIIAWQSLPEPYKENNK